MEMENVMKYSHVGWHVTRSFSNFQDLNSSFAVTSNSSTQFAAISSSRTAGYQNLLVDEDVEV
jgi:hypothetical protein